MPKSWRVWSNSNLRDSICRSVGPCRSECEMLVRDLQNHRFGFLRCPRDMDSFPKMRIRKCCNYLILEGNLARFSESPNFWDTPSLAWNTKKMNRDFQVSEVFVSCPLYSLKPNSSPLNSQTARNPQGKWQTHPSPLMLKGYTASFREGRENPGVRRSIREKLVLPLGTPSPQDRERSARISSCDLRHQSHVCFLNNEKKAWTNCDNMF